MNLPAEVLQSFDPSTVGEPRVELHSLFDLGGDVGETHLVADGHSLHLFTRKLGGGFESRSAPLARIGRLHLGTEGLYEVLGFDLEGRPCSVRFTSWDRPELDKLQRLWKAVAPPGAQVDDTAPPALPLPLEIRIPVAARVLLAASLEAMAEADGAVQDVERAAIQRVLGDSPAGPRGVDHLRRHGVEALLAGLAAGLTPAQKLCLTANLIAVAMSDGLLRSAEQTLLDRFRWALGLSDTEYQTIYDVLLTQNNLAVFGTGSADATGAGGPTPAEVFCASLYALAQEDGRVAEEELEALTRLIPDEGQWARAAENLARRGSEVWAADASRLDRPQRRCLLANLLGLAMADGWLRGIEQAEIERFRQAMAIPTEDYATIYRVLMAKDDLSVFPTFSG